MNRLSSAVCLFTIAGLANAASPPTLVSYQGRITDGGAPANGSYGMVFRTFTDSVAGTEIMVEGKSGINAVSVSNGVFSTTLGANSIINDGAGAGVYTNYGDVFRDFSIVWMQVEVNGTPVLPRQRMVAAPYALNSTNLNGLSSGSFLRSDTSDTYTSGTLTISGSSTLSVQGGFNVDNDTTLVVGGDPALFKIDGTNMVLTLGTAADRTVIPGQVEVGDDLTVGNRAFLGYNAAGEGDRIIYFFEDGSNTGEEFRWDDSVDRFVFSDGIHVQGNVTIEDPDGFSDIQSSGGITIRIDTDNNESGANAGVFSINANQAEIFGTPLLQIQSTDEANLLLDNGVTTDAFDFAEAFRPVAGQCDMEPGDVVALAVGGENKEHVARTTQAGQAMLLGVVSTNPAFTCGMGISSIQESDADLAKLQETMFYAGDQWAVRTIGNMLQTRVRQEWRPIAMLGRVPCKVDTKYGVIRAGDRLTSSPTAGHAMKQTGPGMSLGIAMEDASQPGKILVLVRPMWYGGSSEDFGNLAETTKTNVVNASHVVAPPAADSARVAELEAETRDLKARLADLERLVTAQMQGNRVLTQK